MSNKENKGFFSYFKDVLKFVVRAVFFPFTIIAWAVNKHCDKKADKVINEYADALSKEAFDSFFNKNENQDKLKDFLYERIKEKFDKYYVQQKNSVGNLQGFLNLESEINDPLKNNKFHKPLFTGNQEVFNKYNLLDEYKKSNSQKSEEARAGKLGCAKTSFRNDLIAARQNPNYCSASKGIGSL